MPSEVKIPVATSARPRPRHANVVTNCVHRPKPHDRKPITTAPPPSAADSKPAEERCVLRQYTNKVGEYTVLLKAQRDLPSK